MFNEKYYTILAILRRVRTEDDVESGAELVIGCEVVVAVVEVVCGCDLPFVFGFVTEDEDEDDAAGAGVAAAVATAALEALPALLAVPLERVTTLRFNGKSSSSESLRVKSTCVWEGERNDKNVLLERVGFAFVEGIPYRIARGGCRRGRLAAGYYAGLADAGFGWIGSYDLCKLRSSVRYIWDGTGKL